MSTHRFEVLRSLPFVHCQQVSHLVKDLLRPDEMLEFENTKWFVNYSGIKLHAHDLWSSLALLYAIHILEKHS